MVSDADDDEELSGSDGGEGFNEDMEALRRACILTGTNPEALRSSSAAAASESDEDDLELVRGIQQRFSACSQAEVPLFLKPLSTLPPATSDDDDDDFETLRVIQRRFASYDGGGLKNNKENYLNKQEQIHANNIDSEKGTSNNIDVERTSVSKAVLESLDVHISEYPETYDKTTSDTCPPGLIEGHESCNTRNLAMIPSRGSGFPKAAQMFVDAIKKNRACQKFIRNKMIQMEARIEENNKLKQHVRVLKEYQVSCKRRTGRALSQKNDARVQLISAAKPTSNLKVNGKKVSASCYGPDENPHVVSYKMVLKKFPMSLSRRRWSNEERENLAKGVKQQFQELLLHKSIDLISEVEGDSNHLDGMLASIRDLDITPENIRKFLPKVNWERLASMYVARRSGAECETRWLNWEDPLVNHNPWAILEDKKLLHIVQQRGISNWIDIAVLLGTNRTPFQCLARYQRSLNASVMRREWTEDEDEKLRAAVAAFGETNWTLVASTLGGRTGPQCSNRWIKSLHPARERTGRWSSDEDKRLKVAVMLFGPKAWRKIAQFVPGRTHVQCRERWFNSLDPSLNLGEWTEEEDSKLKAAIVEYGYCWSKVATCVPPRTDNQCRRRWKVLFPHEVPLLQAARKIQKAALISNFVDRESERPTLGPNDFIPLALTNAVSESEELNHSGKRRRKSRPKKATKEAQICSEEVPLSTNGADIGNFAGDGTKSKKKRVTKQSAKKGDGTISKKKRMTKQLVMNKETSEPREDVRDGQEDVPFDGETKKEKSTRRQERKLRGRPKEKDSGTAPRVDTVVGRETMTESCPNKSTDPTNSHLSAFGDSELLNMTNGEVVGEHNGNRAPKNKRSSKLCCKKNERGKRFDEAASSFGENEACSEVRRLSSTYLEQDGHADPTEVNSSPCPDSTSLRITNVNEAETFGNDHIRRKNSARLCSSRIKYSTLREISNITETSGVETFCSGILKKRERKRSLEKRSGLNHSSLKSSSMINKEVDAIGGNDTTKKRKTYKEYVKSDFIPEISRTGDNIGSPVWDHSSSCGKGTHNGHPGVRKGFKPRAKKSGNAKLGEKFLTVDNGTPKSCGIHRWEKVELIRSRIGEELTDDHKLGAEDEDDMTLSSFIKNQRKKRRLSSAQKTTPFGEISKEPMRIDPVEVQDVCDAGDDLSDTCSAPPWI